jgi:bifunctional DNA-binding transcriptional regulator/antitoxin component of YhaV-PrlF toxin-antitoxin module
VEEFLARVFKDGKVTIPKRLRSFCGVRDGYYVRLALVEVLRQNDVGEWKKTKVE